MNTLLLQTIQLDILMALDNPVSLDDGLQHDAHSRQQSITITIVILVDSRHSCLLS